MHPTPRSAYGPETAASLLLWARAGTDRQTDGRTDGQRGRRTLYCYIDKPEVEIWWKISIRNAKSTEIVAKSLKFCTVIGKRGRRIEQRCLTLHGKFINNRFCTSAVQMLLYCYTDAAPHTMPTAAWKCSGRRETADKNVQTLHRKTELNWCWVLMSSSSVSNSYPSTLSTYSRLQHNRRHPLQYNYCHSQYKLKCLFTSCLQCFDAVGWAAGRASSLQKKPEWWGTGMVICLERDADMHMAQLMQLPLTVSCFTKIQIGLPFWYRLTRVVPEKGG